jgi:hypothetical protein
MGKNHVRTFSSFILMMLFTMYSYSQKQSGKALSTLNNVGSTITFYYDGNKVVDSSILLPSGKFPQGSNFEISNASLGGPTPVNIGSIDNIYITDPDHQEYKWEITGGKIIDGGTATDHFVQIEWSTIGYQSVFVSYQDTDLLFKGRRSTNLPIKVENSEKNRVLSGFNGEGQRISLVYPIPSNTELYVVADFNSIIKITDISGLPILSTTQDQDGGKKHIDTSLMSEGIYVLSVKSLTGFSMQKIVISHR